jgi:hypothetical protein
VTRSARTTATADRLDLIDPLVPQSFHHRSARRGFDELFIAIANLDDQLRHVGAFPKSSPISAFLSIQINV